MKIAFSPCPNDTYLFYAWIKGLVGQELAPHPILADIQQLNAWGMKKTFPLTKLSLHCFAKVVYTYQLLPIGFALGFNCGPKIIAKIPFHLSELSNKTIAIPGKETTAHLLLSRLSVQPKKKLFCLYHEINTLIEKGEADCGVIIHESRFTFQEAGFVEILTFNLVPFSQAISTRIQYRSQSPSDNARITRLSAKLCLLNSNKLREHRGYRLNSTDPAILSATVS